MIKQNAGARRRAARLIFPVALNIAIAVACNGLFGSAFGWMVTDRADYPALVGNGLPFLQFVAVAYLVDRLFRVGSDSVAAMRPGRKGMPKLALQLVSVVIYFSFLGASVKFVFGESVGTVLAASGIVGLAVGFALRGLLADIFSGIALHLDSSLATGDWIDVNLRGVQVTGRLVDIQWRTVVIADRMENLVFVPNSEFATATVVNRSCPQVASEYSVSLPVDSKYDRARVIQVMENALARAVGDGTLLAEPGPYVRLAGVEAGSVVYRMYYCIDLRRVSPARAQSAALGYAIDFLGAAGIRLHPVRHAEYGRPRIPGQDRLTEMTSRLRVLANVPLLGVLSHAELARLAEASLVYSVSGGQSVMRAGEEGDSMVVVLEGRLEVMVEDADGPRPVAILWPGECAGEMSLLTGSPRSASVAAVTPAWLLEVPKAALTPILQANPALVEHIAATVENRRAAANGAGKAAGTALDGPRDDGLVSRIRHFFRM